MTAIPAGLALKGLDAEETRLKSILARLAEDMAKAKRELDEIQVARRVLQRINMQSEQPQTDSTSSDDEETRDGITIKEAATRALKAVYPKGLQKSGIENWIKEHLKQEINSSSLSVMLARLRDDDGAIMNEGTVWFYKSPKDSKAA